MTMLFCAAHCRIVRAQSAVKSEIEITGRLPDGSLILTIDGVKYRAINADGIRRIQETKINLTACQDEKAVLTAKAETLGLETQTAKQDAAAAGEQTRLEAGRADDYKKLFENERELRLEAEKLKTQPKQNIILRILKQPAVAGAIVIIAGKIIGIGK